MLNRAASALPCRDGRLRAGLSGCVLHVSFTHRACCADLACCTDVLGVLGAVGRFGRVGCVGPGPFSSTGLIPSPMPPSKSFQHSYIFLQFPIFLACFHDIVYVYELIHVMYTSTYVHVCVLMCLFHV